MPLAQPVTHVSWYEADAWCRWAGRRLPTEVEWEHAALAGASRGLRWGQVWEWTASTFRPYPGFSADPLRDYSQPWFGSHKVLRGASFATRVPDARRALPQLLPAGARRHLQRLQELRRLKTAGRADASPNGHGRPSAAELNGELDDVTRVKRVQRVRRHVLR